MACSRDMHKRTKKENGEETEISQHAKGTCSFCGKTKMKRGALGIWHCGSCMKTVAAGATSVLTVKSTVRRLQDPKDTDDTAHQALNHVNNSNPSRDAAKSTRQSRVREAEHVTSGTRGQKAKSLPEVQVKSLGLILSEEEISKQSKTDSVIKLGAQAPDVVQVILHGEGQVHQVVEVYGIVLHLAHLKLEGSLITCDDREAIDARAKVPSPPPKGSTLGCAEPQLRSLWYPLG
ncbi:hypothetical protein U0070_024698 [Myodes glareolus]|uniref:Ribosomal protein L37a n=1 Tax=Myodes glareolus TaxID=447135 RepID=A0AAW0HQC8_MYOGA